MTIHQDATFNIRMQFTAFVVCPPLSLSHSHALLLFLSLPFVFLSCSPCHLSWLSRFLHLALFCFLSLSHVLVLLHVHTLSHVLSLSFPPLLLSLPLAFPRILSLSLSLSFSLPCTRSFSFSIAGLLSTHCLDREGGERRRMRVCECLRERVTSTTTAL